MRDDYNDFDNQIDEELRLNRTVAAFAEAAVRRRRR